MQLYISREGDGGLAVVSIPRMGTFLEHINQVKIYDLCNNRHIARIFEMGVRYLGELEA